MPGRAPTIALAGWLFADLLLGLFALLAVANTIGPHKIAAPTSTPTPVPMVPPPTSSAPSPSPSVGVDPKYLNVQAIADLSALFAAPGTVAAEQARIAGVVRAAIPSDRVGHKVAYVLAFGHHADPTTGDRIADLGSGALRTIPGFEDAVIRSHFHDIDPAHPGLIELEVYFFY